MKSARTFRPLVCAMVALVLSACGGGENVTIGGTLSGLGTGLTVVLQNNNSDDLTLASNGSFEFANAVSSPAGYDVTVRTQPTGQTCTVSNGSGTVEANDATITNVKVTCTTTASLGGTVSGLVAGASVTLVNAGTTLVVNSNGEFAFPGILAAGASYNVTVSVQPAVGHCTVASGSGTVTAETMARVTVTCG